MAGGGRGPAFRGRMGWSFPRLDRRAATAPSWTATLDSLRAARGLGEHLAYWRRSLSLPIMADRDSVRIA